MIYSLSLGFEKKRGSCFTLFEENMHILRNKKGKKQWEHRTWNQETGALVSAEKLIGFWPWGCPWAFLVTSPTEAGTQKEELPSYRCNRNIPAVGEPISALFPFLERTVQNRSVQSWLGAKLSLHLQLVTLLFLAARGLLHLPSRAFPALQKGKEGWEGEE